MGALFRSLIGSAFAILAVLPPLVQGQANTTSPTMAPTFEFTGDCYDNTTILYEIMLRADFFVDKEYILCPNQVYQIGNTDTNGNCCEGGDRLLVAPSRSILKCGQDGRSINNCIVRGGNIQFNFGGGVFGVDILTDVTLMGLTFEENDFFSVNAISKGDLTFIDCVWRVRIYCCFLTVVSTRSHSYLVFFLRSTEHWWVDRDPPRLRSAISGRYSWKKALAGR